MFLLNDTGFRICRYYGGLAANNVTTIQNSDSSPLYFSLPIGVNIAPTNNIDLAVNGNISSTTVFTTNLSCLNASFDGWWARIMTVDPATLWEVCISLAGVVEEIVSYSTIYILAV